MEPAIQISKDLIQISKFSLAIICAICAVVSSVYTNIMQQVVALDPKRVAIMSCVA